MSSSTTPTRTELKGLLEEIGMGWTAQNLDALLDEASEGKRSPEEVLSTVVEMERAERARRSLERRLSLSRIGSFKPMSDFDWEWPDSIDRRQVRRALKQRHMEEGVNVIIMGPHGVAKTMLLKNIAYQAVLAGYTALLVSASRLLSDLSSQDSARALERRLRYYLRFKVLAIDELGYLSYDSGAADLLFEVISRRHAARKPILMTTNLVFRDWVQVFPNATSTVALVDRLTHMAEIIKIEGKSYRRKETMERQARQEQGEG